ncbi:hypothetical protein JXJ21_14965 [candidate division KSB1 bacterium]|nr:hypothetical protein [candidate division KSB1 bacterium]
MKSQRFEKWSGIIIARLKSAVSTIPCDAHCRTACSSFNPATRATNALIPAATQFANAFTVQMTKLAAPSAATAFAPSRPIQNRSMNSNSMIDTTEIIAGIASLKMPRLREPWRTGFGVV